MEAPKPSWAALLQQPSDPREGDFSSSPALPLSNISSCCSLSVPCFVLLSAQKLSCWGASPSAGEESTFRKKKKGLVTTARHTAWTPQFLPTRHCDMLAPCIKDALHNLVLKRTLSDAAAPEEKPPNHKRACCSSPASPQAPFYGYLKNFLQKSAGYQWAANIKIKSGTVIGFPAKGIGQFMANGVQ